ncbi:MAG: hypothetical protein KGZ58_05020 [Ignavibacteriales bacterium]|nr:hypothetical protein [Ignavibacteriales bacterium]
MKNNTIERDFLLTEYQDVGENWRFFIGTRFITLGFFTTFNSALITALGFALTQGMIVDKETLILWTAVSGIVFTCLIIFIEVRTRRLFLVSLSRGIEIENLLKLNNGQYYMFRQSERGKRFGKFIVTHTKAIFLIYGFTLIAWISLYLYGSKLITQVSK